MSQNVNQTELELAPYIPSFDLPLNAEYISTDRPFLTLPTLPPGAVYWKIYTPKDIRVLKELQMRSRAARKMFNKRKKQKRARTGRR